MVWTLSTGSFLNTIPGILKPSHSIQDRHREITVPPTALTVPCHKHITNMSLLCHIAIILLTIDIISCSTLYCSYYMLYQR